MRRIAIAILILLAPAAAFAETEVVDEDMYRCKDGATSVAMTFKPEMEVRELVTWGMALTCKTFMLEPRTVPVGRKVTLIAPGRMSKAEAYQMFLAALATAGLTIVPKGKAFKIVDAPLAKTNALPIFSKGLPDDTDQIVRFVVRPTYAKPETLVKAFTALKSDAGDVQVIGTLVLVTDYGSHVRSMMSLKKLVDVAEGTDAIYTLPVKHADASKLVTEIETILGLTSSGPAGKGAETTPSNLSVPTKMLVDTRTNTLVIAASDAAFQRVAALVERLDIALDIEGGASIHVYKLSHAIAIDLAAVLTQTVTGQGAKPAPGAGPTAAPPPPAAADTPRLDGEVRVIAEKASNSLIVMSSGRDYFAIREIIRQLDEPRRQVYIEGVIAEVQLSDDLETGVSGHGFLPGSGDSVLLGGVQTGSGVSSLDIESLAAATGLVTGLMSGGTTTLMGTTISSYGLLFTALATKTNSNVLAQPNMIAADNEETQYTIGTNIPYKRGLTYGGLAGTAQAGSTTVNIDRMDLELKLDIKPHISDDDTVFLEISHEAKDLGDTGGELGPTWNTRKLVTKVSVRNQQTIVIGGMISEKDYVVNTQIPILGDIPVLGRLFKHSVKQKRKSNLVILLTPYILRDGVDVETIRARRVREHTELVRSFRSLDGRAYEPKVDYRHKRGMVEEINRALLAVEEDAALRSTLRDPPRVQAGPVEVRAPE
jgi:general secretion pathway protein D